MDPELAKLLWLVGLLGVCLCISIMLLRIDKNDAWKNANVAQLFLNKHGGLDLAAVMLWINMAFDMLVIIFCMFQGNVPERLDVMVGAFNLTFAAPICFKIFKGGGNEPARKANEPTAP